jgi:hypothetical protein
MSRTLSLRCASTMYKRLRAEDGTSRRNHVPAQSAFYCGARCVLQVLDHIGEGGEIEELQRAVRRHRRAIWVLQDQTPRKRRH